MALRVGGFPPQEEAISEPAVLPEEPLAPEMPMEAPMGGGQVSPEAARYFGAEARCMNCIHFTEGGEGGGTCEIVSGPIDPQGVCMLFVQDAEEEMPMEDPEADLEVPVEDEEA